MELLPEKIREAQGGSQEAFQWLARSFHEEVRAYALRLAVRIDLSDDLAQEILWEACRSIGRYRAEEGPFSQWLRGIARNLARQQWRTHRQRLQLERDGLAEFVETISEGDGSLDPLVLKEEVAAMRACLEKLSAHSARLLHLRHVQGLSSQEIAEIIRKRPSAIRTALLRVRRSLQQCIEARVGGGALPQEG